MNSLFFWLIVLSFLVPAALRLYRKSVRGRDQGYPGPQNTQPRDGFTQRDYYGGFGQLGAPQPPLPPAHQQYPGQPYPGQQGYQPYPGQQGFQSPVPYEDSPEYPGNQYPGNRPQAAPQPPAPPVPPQPSAPQGFRARKLAELDQQYSNGELGMEEYMARRNDIMNG